MLLKLKVETCVKEIDIRLIVMNAKIRGTDFCFIFEVSFAMSTEIINAISAEDFNGKNERASVVVKMQRLIKTDLNGRR